MIQLLVAGKHKLFFQTALIGVELSSVSILKNIPLPN